jgi:hypothetical protein
MYIHMMHMYHPCTVLIPSKWQCTFFTSFSFSYRKRAFVLSKRKLINQANNRLLLAVFGSQKNKFVSTPMRAENNIIKYLGRCM